MKSDLVFCDGVLLRSDEVRISPFDMGLTVGDGVFETLLVRDEEVFAFSRHFARLQDSAALVGMEVPDEDVLREQASVLIQASGVVRGRLRITLSAGVSGDRGGRAAGKAMDGTSKLLKAMDETSKPLKAMDGTSKPLLAGAFARVPENQRVLLEVSEILDGGITAAVVVLSETRRFSASIAARAKTLSYGENVWALRAGQGRGADEVLLANERGELCEGAMTNVFVRQDGAWRTPPVACGCLAGVTRALVSDLLTLEGELSEKVLMMSDLEEIEEMVLTSSLRGVWPVGKLDGRILGTSEGAKLAARYEELVAAEVDP